jgi:hypothetical protein
MSRHVKVFVLLLTAAVLLVGCSSASENLTSSGDRAPVQGISESAGQSPTDGNPVSVTPASDNQTTVAEQPQTAAINRVDVIYFHVNQRCPTCLCFEQRINHVVEANFNDAISSGKMTYRVLNAQQQQNADIARKYGAVGSQLCINTVIDGRDNIENVIDIWKWDCRYNAPNFDRHVKSVIEGKLEKIQ